MTIDEAWRIATCISGRLSSSRRTGWQFGYSRRLMSCTVTTVATGEPIGIMPFVKCATSGRSASSARCRAQLHPADANRKAMAVVDAHVRRQRRLRVDRLVRHHDDLVAGVDDFAGEVLQQVLGVVPDTRAPRRQRRAVKRRCA